MFKKFLLVTLILLSLLLLCSCSLRSNEDKRFTKNFWSQKSELRIGLDNVIIDDSSSNSKNQDITSEDMREYQKELVKDLKVKLNKYFLDTYSIDISDKLNNQQIKFFKDTTESSNPKTWTGGYFIPTESNTIYLNNLLVHDKRSEFTSIYIYETMYNIGFHSGKNLFALDTGFADNEAKNFCKYAKLEYSSVSNNYFVKKLAEQMKIANPDLIKNYISDSNFSISDEINSRLSDVKMPFIKINDPGNKIQSYITAFLSPELYKKNDCSPWLSFQAQEIVTNYCKQFKLTDSQISKIRENYAVDEYEKIQVYKENNKYMLKYLIF